MGSIIREKLLPIIFRFSKIYCCYLIERKLLHARKKKENNHVRSMRINVIFLLPKISGCRSLCELCVLYRQERVRSSRARFTMEGAGRVPMNESCMRCIVVMRITNNSFTSRILDMLRKKQKTQPKNWPKGKCIKKYACFFSIFYPLQIFENIWEIRRILVLAPTHWVHVRFWPACPFFQDILCVPNQAILSHMSLSFRSSRIGNSSPWCWIGSFCGSLPLLAYLAPEASFCEHLPCMTCVSLSMKSCLKSPNSKW